MKKRKLHRPILHIERRCTKALSADSHRLLNACALAYWAHPDPWEADWARIQERSEKLLAELDNEPAVWED